MNRVDPVQPPYAPGVAERLEAMMPPGVPPILLFRTFVRNLPMATAMGSWGSYELSRHLSLPMRAREIVIDRVALSTDQVASLTHGNSWDECWTDDSDRLLIEAVDSLHGSSHISDGLWARLAEQFDELQLLDLLLLCGWYHAISFAANGAQVALEPNAPRFTDVPHPR